MKRKIKVARIATVPFFLDHQLKHQLHDLLMDGFDVTAISSAEGDWSGLKGVEGLECLQVNIVRQPAPIRDLIALFSLYRCFRKNEFDIVHSTTPKAGLLCAIAGYLARVPVRIHTFTGQPWATKKGLSQKLYCLLDKLIVRLNTRGYADSESQRRYLNTNGVGDNHSIQVLGNGSLAGVDLERFNPEKHLADKQQTMTELKLSADDFVITFLGRLSEEKGLYELLEAVNILAERYESIKLLLVGPCEESALGEYLTSEIKKPFICYVGETNLPEHYLAVSSLLCLPSYREGFGTVVIEAAAMKLPTVGSRITGLVDAIIDGETGTLVEPANIEQLVGGLEQYVTDPKKCIDVGEQAFSRCQQIFDSKKISQLMKADYLELHDGKYNNEKSSNHRR